MRASHHATLIVNILKNEIMDNLHLAAEAGRDDTGVEVSELSYIGHAQSSPLAPPPSAPMPLALPPLAPAPSAAVDMPHHHRHHPHIHHNEGGGMRWGLTETDWHAIIWPAPGQHQHLHHQDQHEQQKQQELQSVAHEGPAGQSFTAPVAAAPVAAASAPLHELAAHGGWRIEGDEFIGRRVRRFKAPTKPSEGTVVRWLPQAENESLLQGRPRGPLWHVLLDGDEEEASTAMQACAHPLSPAAAVFLVGPF